MTNNNTYFCYRQSLEKTFLRSQKQLILLKLFLPYIVLVCFVVPDPPGSESMLSLVDPDPAKAIEVDSETQRCL